MTTTPPPIVLCQSDCDSLMALLDSPSYVHEEKFDALREELTRAKVVADDQLPANIVRMNSTVEFEEKPGVGRGRLTLVYPGQADPSTHKVSILAPVGSAIIGLSEGQSIAWPLPNGQEATLTVVAVLF